MSWTSILTALVLAIVSADLVLIEAWEPWQALLVVSVGAILVIVGLLAFLLVLAGKEQRKEVMGEFLAATRASLRAMLDWTKGR